MELRVARLEEDMKEVRGDLKKLLETTARIDGRLDHMPSTVQMVTLTLGMLALTFGGDLRDHQVRFARNSLDSGYGD